MSLNIITRSHNAALVYGSGKVLTNTLKGLEKLGKSYSINLPLNRGLPTWVHDSRVGLIEASLSDRPTIMGPNIAVVPSELPRFRGAFARESFYLFPSQWPLDAWTNDGFSECRMAVWAAGIDTDYFRRSITQKARTLRALVYLKNRPEKDLLKVTEILTKLGVDFVVLRYGSYTESAFKEILEGVSFAIWIAGTESQGFAMMEAMSADVPILVLDTPCLAQNFLDKNVPPTMFSAEFLRIRATSAPCFDERCGVKLTTASLEQMDVERFVDRLYSFSPRAYIEERYTLKQCAQVLLNIAESLPSNGRQSTVYCSRGKATLLFVLDLLFRPSLWCFIVRKVLRNMNLI